MTLLRRMLPSYPNPSQLHTGRDPSSHWPTALCIPPSRGGHHLSASTPATFQQWVKRLRHTNNNTQHRKEFVAWFRMEGATLKLLHSRYPCNSTRYRYSQTTPQWNACPVSHLHLTGGSRVDNTTLVLGWMSPRTQVCTHVHTFFSLFSSWRRKVRLQKAG